ncbi:MAG: hypothetical protein K2X43_06885 [Hyphomonadaceae bacterium]|nr:hypothetical protein [Hyphomonadaceae bacterium]
MKAFIARNRSGSVTRGWLLRTGTSIDSTMCGWRRGPVEETVEEVSVEAAVRAAAENRPGRLSGLILGEPAPAAASVERSSGR